MPSASTLLLFILSLHDALPIYGLTSIMLPFRATAALRMERVARRGSSCGFATLRRVAFPMEFARRSLHSRQHFPQIGRASCRERGEITGGLAGVRVQNAVGVVQ